MSEQRASREYVWCSKNRISTANYYKWQKHILQMATVNTPQFVELQRSARLSVVAVLHMGDAEGVCEEKSVNADLL